MAGLEVKELQKIASELGSDCPFFIESVPAYAEGRGEIINPTLLDLSGYYLVLFNPGIHVSTRDAYKECKPERPEDKLENLVLQPITKWKDIIINDFENSVFKKYPIIGEIKEELYRSGAIYSSMSGSGSTVYGIFEKKPEIPGHLKENLIYSGIM